MNSSSTSSRTKSLTPHVVSSRTAHLLLLGSAALLASQPVAAAPQISVSGGVSQTESAVRDHPSDQPLALIVDTASLGAAETESLLHAIEDRRRAGGLTVAVIGPISDGSALLALSCDAMVALPSARLTGADESWCTSPSRRDDLVETVQRLGRIPEPLVRRFVGTSGALSWDKSAGFQDSEAGTLLLASEGAAIELSTAQLQQTGLSSRDFKDPSAATAAIDGRMIRARAAAPSTVAAQGSTPPRGRPPVPPAAPPTSAPSAPAAPAAPSAPPVDMAKLTPKLQTYSTQIAELKAKVAAFDRYYRGVDGVWTTPHKSLKAVWQSKTEMTRDKDTKLKCSRLQQDIRELVTALTNSTSAIARTCGDKNHPEVIRTQAALKTLEEFRDAIKANEVDDYDKYKPMVDRLN